MLGENVLTNSFMFLAGVRSFQSHSIPCEVSGPSVFKWAEMNRVGTTWFGDLLCCFFNFFSCTNWKWSLKSRLMKNQVYLENLVYSPDLKILLYVTLHCFFLMQYIYKFPWLIINNPEEQWCNSAFCGIHKWILSTQFKQHALVAISTGLFNSIIFLLMLISYGFEIFFSRTDLLSEFLYIS